ncbi:hypothetical protein ACROYT_G020138 [Oculina patagonica]
MVKLPSEKTATNDCNVIVILLTILVTVISIILIISCAISVRRSRNFKSNQLDDQHGSSLRSANEAREPGLLPEADVDNIKRGNQRRETEDTTGQECGYAMLSPSTMMVQEGSSYTSLVKSKEGAQDSVNECTVVAFPLLQPDEELRDESPIYVNQMRLSNYMNV